MEELNSWLDIALEESNSQWEDWKEELIYIKNKVSFYWIDYLSAYLKKLIDGGGQEDLNGFGLLLTGPDGCGKHMVTKSVMKLMEDKLDAYALVLSGPLLGDASLNETVKRLGDILDTFKVQRIALCLMVEELEEHPFRREILTYLGRRLREYRRKGEEFFYLVLIDRDERTVPNLLRRRLQLCRVSLPDQQQRRSIIGQFEDGFKQLVMCDYFAQITEGLTCAQLKDLAQAVVWQVDQMNPASSLPNEELLRFCRSQMPLPEPEDALPSIAASLRQLVENLPQALQNLPAAGSDDQLANQPLQKYNENRIDEVKFMQDETERIKNATPRQLAEELYGKDFIEKHMKENQPEAQPEEQPEPQPL